jgi:hypothetical protein
MQRAESQPTQLTVNQAAGVTVNAAQRLLVLSSCCPAGQSEPRSLPRFRITCSMTATDGQQNRTGGPGGVASKLTVPAYGFLQLECVQRCSWLALLADITSEFDCLHTAASSALSEAVFSGGR